MVMDGLTFRISLHFSLGRKASSYKLRSSLNCSSLTLLLNFVLNAFLITLFSKMRSQISRSVRSLLSAAPKRTSRSFSGYSLLFFFPSIYLPLVCNLCVLSYEDVRREIGCDFCLSIDKVWVVSVRIHDP